MEIVSVIWHYHTLPLNCGQVFKMAACVPIECC